MADENRDNMTLVLLSRGCVHHVPDGGVLAIATRRIRFDAPEADLPAGEFVAIDVRDTGAGMPPEIIDHVFEPFFTTKGIGKGTGLGLAQVFGTARQCGGASKLRYNPRHEKTHPPDWGSSIDDRVYRPDATTEAGLFCC